MNNSLPTHKSSDKKMENFLEKIDLERNTGKQVIYIQNDIKLNSALSIAQYIYNKNRLITIIGEYHNSTWKCDEPNMDISTYCKNAVERNPRCKILLEYNNGDNPLGMGSETIREVYRALLSINRTDAVVPYDTRAFFLSINGQGDLYNTDGYMKHATTWVNIGNVFIEPFFRKIRENPKLFKLLEKYPPNIKYYLEYTYMIDVLNTFKHIAENMFGRNSGEEVHKALKDAWKKVCDFFVLRTILMEDNNVDEYIVIMGLEHFNYVTSILKTLTYEIGFQTGGHRQTCINLYETYLI